MNVIDKAINWAVSIANDNSHGYDQIHRWLNPDVDCSSLVVLSFETAGVPVREAGATYTGNMKKAFEKCGFKAIPYVKGMTLIRGDVVVCDHYGSNGKYYGHTLIYLGDGKIVQASIGDKGATGNKGGDQTGKEVSVGKFYEYSKGWDYVLRYPEQEEEIIVQVNMKQIQKGDICVEVGMLQTLLNKLGYKGSNGRSLTVDNDFGTNCDYAVKNFQKNKGLNPDGIVGVKTWDFLVKSNYI